MLVSEVIVPIRSSRTLGKVALMAFAIGIYALLPMWKEFSSLRDYGDVPSDLHATLSLVLGALLVFRTNSAYSRWWEARTLWGALVNAIRNLSIKLTCFGRPDQANAERLRSMLAEFPHELMLHLRSPNGVMVPVRSDHLSNASGHRLIWITQQIYRWVEHQKHKKIVDGDELRAIDMELSKLMDICGGCERIARTPFVRSYRTFSRQCIVLFLLTLPWGIANDFGWWTIPLTVLLSYFMIGMETVAEHVEEPFGLDEDDLDLESLCRTIEKSVNEIFENPTC